MYGIIWRNIIEMIPQGRDHWRAFRCSPSHVVKPIKRNPLIKVYPSIFAIKIVLLLKYLNTIKYKI